MNNWTDWKSMPAPENCRNIDAAKKSGIYQIRNKNSKDLIQFGIGGRFQTRMKSLFPQPYGRTGRNNQNKRNHILANWKNLEYRTLETETREIAAEIEKKIKAQNNHLFNT